MFKLHHCQSQLHTQRNRVEYHSSQAEGIDISTLVSCEQKIDAIAREIGDLKLLIKGLNLPSDENQPTTRSIWNPSQTEPVKPLADYQSISTTSGEPVWDHSAHIIDFIKAVLKDRGSRVFETGAIEVLPSLEKLVQALEDPFAAQDVSLRNTAVAKPRAKPSMPPLDAVVTVLRWAKDHEGFTRMAWLSQILPLQTFTDICRKVYFAVEEYSEIDFLLANGYLSYIFSEHVIVSGLPGYRGYCQLCRENLDNSLSQLPLLLPASMEVIAALTLGTFNAVENSKATVAWKFASAAADLCQTLGYHRFRPQGGTQSSLRATQERLFWTVYAIEKGLSLRLGRSSNIRDAEITLPFDPDESRSTKLGRLNGIVYDQLYSPTGLSRPDDERTFIAATLAGDLRELINDTRTEISNVPDHHIDDETDPMRITYLRCDLVCEFSILALILRAIPMTQGSMNGILDDCLAVAREALDIHEQCMKDLQGCKNDPFMVTKYINWAILYCPFAPFSILFTRAVQLSDMADLARLDRFATSLQPASTPPEAITHPYRLYKLLCQAARLYFDSDTPSQSTEQNTIPNTADFWAEFDFVQSGIETATAVDQSSKTAGSQTYELYDWAQDAQQIMGFLSEDVMF
ncbi:hypothetical protein BP6252_05941 [Coleophoma cylindrospora]|uniref:Xylanolytic transcriptional activator regulatory domain-containing protein n=1 Tax=Coleophoma cylindrospora TaxID=1849047 RepID=A0A3D8RL86_9HELO|nr:hypothetical protein BP6252_05941 [Coleophoma cylindrospora]